MHVLSRALVERLIGFPAHVSHGGHSSAPRPHPVLATCFDVFLLFSFVAVFGRNVWAHWGPLIR